MREDTVFFSMRMDRQLKEELSLQSRGGNVSALVRSILELHTDGSNAFRTITNKIELLDSLIHSKRSELMNLEKEKAMWESKLKNMQEEKNKYLEYRQTLLEQYALYRKRRGKDANDWHEKNWLEGRGDLIIKCDFEDLNEALQYCRENVSR